MRAIRWTAGAVAALTFVLIVLGAVVRSTNSGLSCPDWPTCYGQWLPLPSHVEGVPGIGYTYGQVMLEWVHRLIAGFFLGPLVLVLALLTFQRRWIRPGLAAAGGALLLLVLVQGLLGGVTVLDRNSPWSVALHLGTALLVLSTALLILVRSLEDGAARPVASRRNVGRVAVVGWLLALLAMVSAAVTAKTGASFACTNWPLCGRAVPEGGDPLVTLHMTHRLLAAAVTLALAALYTVARRDPGAVPPDRALAGAALALVLVEVALGAVVVLHGVPVAAAVVHQAIGVATFVLVTVLMWRCLPLARDEAAAPAEVGGVNGLGLHGARGAV